MSVDEGPQGLSRSKVIVLSVIEVEAPQVEGRQAFISKSMLTKVMWRVAAKAFSLSFGVEGHQASISQSMSPKVEQS